MYSVLLPVSRNSVSGAAAHIAGHARWKVMARGDADLSQLSRLTDSRRSLSAGCQRGVDAGANPTGGAVTAGH
jgi:hypothetical protein